MLPLPASKAELQAALNSVPILTLGANTRVTFVCTLTDLSACHEQLRKALLVGLDSETRPVFRKGAPRQPVSLLQIAMRDAASAAETVFILDLLALPKANVTTVLAELLASTTCTKIGQGFESDLKDLDDALVVHNYIEATDLARLTLGHTALISLQKLTYMALGRRLTKSQQKSNWNLRPLKPAQLTYAALDAAVLLQIYDAIRAETSIEAVASVTQTLDRSVQFVCDNCGATRPTLESLRQHTPTCKAVSAKTLPCGSCHRRFRTPDAVAAHVKTAHGPNAPPLKPKRNKSRTCRACQHVFKTIPAREKARSKRAQDQDSFANRRQDQRARGRRRCDGR
ncbi:hypothetical protein SPRG_16427 [Saprolegnia parasitica CBS 223.65]|uniref:C2H2-type domain-containing protein n=1 Tax=Saprolegnia parasitica (strain CBS 223.65) TaxID=695850 RepID=A0A067BMU1_SAPPC|nr:hypothetical protein SPRG_16427 [Saprolegnia parasitica CBS 223.65]KDO18065.1 hypothetical protein SPRG_16427 [Saprolegnia parasitica CBS 223.65]|eukprot:XP_012211232.1 hypothetical protein SPRG_16427 [Saprolegnia parasitica CBS 223.65]